METIGNINNTFGPEATSDFTMVVVDEERTEASNMRIYRDDRAVVEEDALRAHCDCCSQSVSI